MKNLERDIINRKADVDSLIRYGFKKDGDGYYLERSMLDGQFRLIVSYSQDGFFSRVFENDTKEEYVLADVPSSIGAFVGRVKSERQDIVDDIVAKCFVANAFKSFQANRLEEYALSAYGDELEFLWDKFAGSAVWRNKRTKKWYGVLLTINESKLGLPANDIVEIVDLRYQKDLMDSLIGSKKFFRGYHMNKESWITIVLDGSVETNEIFRLMDNSYALSLGK